MKPSIFRMIMLFAIFSGLVLSAGFDYARASSSNDAYRGSHSAAPEIAQQDIFLPVISSQYCGNFTALTRFTRPAHFPDSALSGEITSPQACQAGLPPATAITASGTPAQAPGGAYLWVFLYTSNGRYYPQCKNALAGICGVDFNDEGWEVPVYLGRPGVKEQFFMLLIEADETANIFLVETLKKWAEEGNYPGLTPEELANYQIEELDGLQVETAGQ